LTDPKYLRNALVKGVYIIGTKMDNIYLKSVLLLRDGTFKPV